jgi:hypothetical protein
MRFRLKASRVPFRPIAPGHNLIMTWPDARRTTARCPRDGRVAMTGPANDFSQAAPRFRAPHDLVMMPETYYGAGPAD